MTSETSAAVADDWIDRVIDQRYRVLERIGQGGMGVVYRVEHVRMGKVAAMKLLHASLSANPSVARRFHNEAEAISKLNHPNIVQVFDFGQADYTLYLVMEYLEGLNLGTVLDRDGPHPFSRSIPLLVQVCDALTEAHSLGIIHRDLKPENIQLSRTRSGHDLVKVLDFGLAKMLQSAGSRTGDTNRSNLVGTPYYMSPEQIRGRDLDQRCDVYGLGAVAFRTITGLPPFNAETPLGVLTKHVTEPLVPPSVAAPELGIPPEIDGVIVRAMAKNRDERFASAAEFKVALLEAANRAANASATSGVRSGDRSTSPASDLATGPQPVIDQRSTEEALGPRLTREDLDFETSLKRSPWLRLGAVLGVLLLLGAAAYALWGREARPVPASEEREPNNDPAHATLIALEKPVAGYLGKRVSAHESDRDWYLLKTPSSRQTLKVSVSSIPNMDLLLELYDAQGNRLAKADSGARGVGEVVTNWPIAAEAYYLLVREVWRLGSIPTENVTDIYSLQASASTTADAWEREPNDGAETANALVLGSEVRGYLGGVTDRDLYVVPAGAGAISGTISPIDGVDLVLEIGDASGAPALVIDELGLSQGESLRNHRLPERGRAIVTVRRKDEAKSEDGWAAGLEQPYTLRLWR